MDKELEKEYLEDLDHYDEGMGIHSTSYGKCKERLIRLAKIDNSKPSEALNCLDTLDDMFYLIKYRTTENGNHEEYEFYPCETKEYDTIKQSLIKSQEQEKVLKIIFEKPSQINVAIIYIKTAFNPTYEDYCSIVKEERQLIKEEFELLKRYFK